MRRLHDCGFLVAGLLLALESSATAQETATSTSVPTEQRSSDLAIPVKTPGWKPLRREEALLEPLTASSEKDFVAPAATPRWQSACASETVCDDSGSSESCGDGNWSIQFLSGYYPMARIGPESLSPIRGPDGRLVALRRDRLDLVPLDLRFGWASDRTFLDDTWLRGKGEVLLELTGGPVTQGLGHFVGGPSLLLRYNFQQTDWRLVPYFQVGAGVVFDDAYHDLDQHLIGGPVEFLTQVQLGFHYHVNTSMSLDAEGGYRHISNADIYSRNLGVNSLGATMGFTYYLGRR